MRREVLWSFLALLSLLFVTLLSSCGSSKKEGTAATPAGSVAATGNLQSDIRGVTINSPPVITFSLFDENGNPLDPTTTGVSVRFTIAQIGADGNYKNYIKSSTAGQPGFDSGGTFATVSPGVYTYTFKTDIKDKTTTLNGLVFDPTLTHTVAAQITRTVTSLAGTSFQQAANPYTNFRPDGGAVTVTREIVSMSACNECHGNLGLHGGGRRDIALCIVCHYPGVVDPDTGSSVDMKDLIHKIHYGEKLPSNKAGGDYTVIGFGGSVNSYKTVAYPFMSGDSTISVTPIECTKCHKAGKDLAGKDYGKDVNKYKQNPTIAKCTSCHDTTTFDGSTTIDVKNGAATVTVPAVPHNGGIQANDSGCAGCHAVSALDTAEYNYGSVAGAHTVLEKSSKYTGINYKILSVTNGTAGNKPTVTFKITDKSGNPVSPAPVSITVNGAATNDRSFNLKFGYISQADYVNNNISATTYAQPISQALSAATSNGDGSYTITFATAIPATATTGIGVVGIEGTEYMGPITTGHKGTNAYYRVGEKSDQYYFDLSTGTAVTDLAKQRRKVVDIDKCNACHSRLSLHGGNRVNSIEECVICHNPNATDKAKRVTGPFADGLTERTINFKDMIHSIHTGEDLNVKPYVIYGNGNTANDFSEVRYPNDRRNCLACHLSGAFNVPLPANVLGTTTATGANVLLDTDNTRTLPTTATCVSCHDSATTATHVASRVVSGAETCVQCHMTGLLLGPDFAHTPVR